MAVSFNYIAATPDITKGVHPVSGPGLGLVLQVVQALGEQVIAEGGNLTTVASGGNKVQLTVGGKPVKIDLVKGSPVYYHGRVIGVL